MGRRTYKICTRCVMDTSDTQIKFDSKGVCNHCKEYDLVANGKKYSTKNKTVAKNEIISQIKKDGEGSEYDCIIGLSGGVDSSYLCYIAVKEFGLKPLIVHLDNGWNSKLATKNIQKIVRNLELDLYTHVIDWEEFKSLQLAFLKASVIDIELLTDYSINAITYKVAKEHNVQYILTGNNLATEKILPKSWTFNKDDLKNIISINKRFGSHEIKTFPTIARESYKEYKKQIKSFPMLNYIDYDKDEAKRIIINELRWEDYGGKHYESIFTRFYQGYILPQKFNVDKRRAHYSTEICSGLMTREKAIEKLKLPVYDEQLMKDDYEYVIKKLDLTKEEFEAIMKSPVKSHFDYDTTLESKLRKKLISPTNPLLKLYKKLF